MGLLDGVERISQIVKSPSNVLAHFEVSAQRFDQNLRVSFKMGKNDKGMQISNSWNGDSSPWSYILKLEWS